MDRHIRRFVLFREEVDLRARFAEVERASNIFDCRKQNSGMPSGHKDRHGSALEAQANKS